MHWTGWMFLVLGTLTTAFGAVLFAIRLRAHRRWTPTVGEVIDSIVAGPDATRSYSAQVTIRWKVGGQEYSNTFDDWSSDDSPALFEKIVARYPKRSAATILYNPADPSKAYLEADNKLYFLLVPAIVIFLGLVIASIGYSV
jgi:Protein of unknown function (DUF3592)